MRSQKDDLVDRRKVEVWQHMEPKRTKRSIAFLCPSYSLFGGITRRRSQQSVFDLVLSSSLLTNLMRRYKGLGIYRVN